MVSFLLYCKVVDFVYQVQGWGRVFSGTCPTSPLMRRYLNLINGFGMDMKFFFLNPEQVRVLPHPASIIYKINFKI